MTTLDIPVRGAKLDARRGPDASAGARRGRGRPLEMAPEAVLAEIRRLAESDALFRVHDSNSKLYARARRQFGSWSQALRAAGLSYEAAMERARARSLETRRMRGGNRRARRPR
jgi:hypothetical protein